MKVRVQDGKRVRDLVIAVGACAVLSACGGEDSPAPAPIVINPPATITSFEISAAAPAVAVQLPSPFSAHVLSVVGLSSQLTARVGMNNGPPADVTSGVEWRSTNTEIATVSASGLVTGLRPGLTSIVAVYQRSTATAFLTVFDSPPTVGGPFTGLLQLGERKPYIVTVGASGGGIVFLLTSSGPGSGLLGVMFGPADGSACRPPYTYGSSVIQTQGAGTGNRSDARTSFFQSTPGRYCVIVLDPATVTAADQIPSSVSLTPMNFPVNYTLTIAVSGPGAGVTP